MNTKVLRNKETFWHGRKDISNRFPCFASDQFSIALRLGGGVSTFTYLPVFMWLSNLVAFIVLASCHFFYSNQHTLTTALTVGLGRVADGVAVATIGSIVGESVGKKIEMLLFSFFVAAGYSITFDRDRFLLGFVSLFFSSNEIVTSLGHTTRMLRS